MDFLPEEIAGWCWNNNEKIVKQNVNYDRFI